MRLQLFIILACGLPLTWCAPSADEVTSLPGWEGPLPSRMYSGFIDVSKAAGRDMHVHYWFLETHSTNSNNDKTILWTNGGPGASSMFGLLAELGPLLLNADSLTTDGYKKTGVPTLFYNDFGWTKLGSIIMFDWPPPVGFSYCSDPKGKGDACGDWDDTRMAEVSYAALAGWFALFPERQHLPLYLTGESYAGVYVPKLAQQILAHKDPAVFPQFQGFAVGDGCLGSKSGVCGGEREWFQLLFLYGHGQLPNDLYDEIVTTCTIEHLKRGGPAPPGCDASLAKVGPAVGGFFPYGIYDDCIYQEGFRRRRLARRLAAASPSGAPQTPSVWERMGFDEESMLAVHRSQSLLEKAGSEGGLGAHNGLNQNNYRCVGDSTWDWTNSTAVRQALHVPLDSYFFTGDNGVGMTYHLTETDLQPFYKEVAKTTKLRVLVYNGDTDPGINSFVAGNWTSHLGFTPTQPWRPWTLDGCRRVGGYVTRYQEDRFDYLTIRGSGHMVPQFKPASAYEFLRAWLSAEDYKPYVKSCKTPSAKQEL